ncbi:MAG: signal peptidase II [Pseudomonadales bacterium]|jgi:signal peptidase II
MQGESAKVSAWTFFSLSALIVLADQVIKWLVQQSMAYGESIEITSFFN